MARRYAAGHERRGDLGHPWPPGALSAGTGFGLQDDRGQALPLQTSPLAYWPDGSLKWTAHALAPQARVAGHYELRPGEAKPPQAPGVQVAEEGADLLLDTGPLRCRIPRQGRTLIRSLARAGRETLTTPFSGPSWRDGPPDRWRPSRPRSPSAWN